MLLRQVSGFENVQIPMLLPQMQRSEKIVKVPDERQRHVPNFQNETVQVLSCENVISLHQLTRQIASAQCFKSPGLDGISNDMLKGSPQQVARHLHPLLCNMSLGCKKPLMLKGSLATDLYKGRGCKLDMTSYRSIVCSRVLSKHHHKFLRSRLLSVVVHFLRDTQCGGIPSRVDMAGLLLRSFLARTSALKRTALFVFYGVKTAFYAVIRQMLLPVPLSREEYLDVLDSVDNPLPLVPILEAAMACPALVPEVSSDKHLTSILTDAHLDTWFHVQDANDLAATLKGTRPGDSLADLLFSILLCPVLDEVQDLESKLGLALGCPKSPEKIAKASDPQEVLCTDITFADDTAFLGVLPAGLPPVDMLSLLHDWALGIHNIFVKRALMPMMWESRRFSWFRPLVTKKCWLHVTRGCGSSLLCAISGLWT